MKRMPARQGVSLIEVMVCVTIISIMWGTAAIVYTTTIEHAWWQHARDTLHLIRLSQYRYALTHDGQYYGPLLGGRTDAAAMREWNEHLHVENPNQDDGPVRYEITLGPDGTTFQASAVRCGGPSNGRRLRLTQDGRMEGDWALPEAAPARTAPEPRQAEQPDGQGQTQPRLRLAMEFKEFAAPGAWKRPEAACLAGAVLVGLVICLIQWRRRAFWAGAGMLALTLVLGAC